MKAFLLLLAAGIAAGSLSSCRQGTLIEYQYENQMLSGVPHFARQVAGLKLTCKVQLQCESEGRFKMMMEDIRMKKIKTELQYPHNGEGDYQQMSESGMVPDDKLSSLDSNVEQELMDEFRKPCEFTYENGKITEVKVSATEPQWSSNVKKGIMSFLQVKLSSSDNCQKTDEDFDDKWGNDKWRNEKWQNRDSSSESDEWKWDSDSRESKDEYKQLFNSRDTPRIHKCMETDISGVCETVYGISRQSMNSDSLSITKVKNFKNCQKSLAYQQGLLSGLSLFPEEISTKDVIERSSHADYKMTGSEENFSIQYARQDSRYIFTPSKLEFGSAVTESIQILRLLSSHKNFRSIHSDEPMRPCHNGLMYDFPNSLSGEHREYVMELDSRSQRLTGNNGEASTEEKINEIKSILGQMIQEIHPELQMSSVEKVKRVSDIMRTMDEQGLLNLCNIFINSEEWRESGNLKSEMSRKGEIIMDILATLNSDSSLRVLAKLITNKKISETRAVLSLKSKALTYTPSFSMINFLMTSNREFCSHPVVTESLRLKTACFTSVSSMVRRLMTLARNQGVSRDTVTSKLSKFYTELKEQLNMANSEMDKVAIVMSLGNTGCPMVMPTLAQTILDKSQSHRVRVVAMAMLTKMPKSSFRRAQKILSSVYIDMTDDQDTRMSALVKLVDMRPTTDMLNLIIRTQRKERSMQVGSFCYSYLSTLSFAQLPGLRNMTRDVRRMLPLLKPIGGNTFFTSKGYYRDYFVQNADWGMGMDTLKINNQQQPSLYITRMMLHIFGKSVMPAKVGIFSSGLSGLFSKAFGVHSNFREAYGESSFNDMLKQLLKPLKEGHVDLGSVAEEIKDIIQKIGITNREGMKEAELGMFLNILGEDMMLFDVRARDILEYIESGRVPEAERISELIKEINTNGKTLDMMRVINLGTSTLQVPSACGMAVSLNWTASAIAHVTGHVKSDIPSLTDIIRYGWSGRIPTDIKFDGSVRPSVGWEWIANFGADCGLVQSSVAVKGKVMSKVGTPFTINVNTDAMKLNMQFQTPESEKEFFTCEIDPMVMFTTHKPRRRMTPEVTFDTLSLSHPSKIETVKADFSSPISFLNLKISQSVLQPVSLPNWMATTFIWAKNNWKFSASSLRSSSPVIIEAEWQRSSDNPHSLMPSRAKIHSSWESANNQHGTQVMIRMGPRSDEQSQAVFTTTVLTQYDSSRSLSMCHVNCKFSRPGDSSNSPMVDLFMDLNGMWGYQQRAQSQPIAFLKGQCCGSSRVDVLLFPDEQEQFQWDVNMKNNVFKIIEKITGERVERETVRPIEQKPRSMTYRLSMDTNIEPSEWTYVSKAAGVAAMTAGYLKLTSTGLPIAGSYIGMAGDTPSSIQGQVKVIPDFQKVLIHVKTTKGYEFGLNVPTFLYTPIDKLISIEKAIPVEDIESGFDFGRQYHGQYTGVCKVRPHVRESGDNQLKTFDSKIYTIPALPSACELLLTKDCAHSMFTVVMKPEGDSKVIKMYIAHNKIELIPVSGWSSSGVKAIVNGNEKYLSERESQIVQDRYSSAAYPSALLLKRGEWTTVDSKKYGITVHTDGKQVIVETSPLMSGHTCGLCGNYDGEWMNDLQGPDMLENPSAKVMISKYVRPSGLCTPQNIRSHYGVKEISAESCRKFEHTKVIQRHGETCFSTLPVQTCPSQCHQSSEKRVEMRSFHCRSSNKISTHRMVQESRSGVITDMEYKKVSKEFEVEIPKRCIPKY